MIYPVTFRFRYHKCTKSNHLYYKPEWIIVYDHIAPRVYLFEIEYVLIYPNIIDLLWLNCCNRANRSIGIINFFVFKISPGRQ